MNTNGTSGMLHPNVQQRAIWWSMEFTKLLVRHTELRDSLPEEATVIILPTDDRELCEHNRSVAKRAKGTVILVELEPAEDSYQVTPFIGRQSYRYPVH